MLNELFQDQPLLLLFTIIAIGYPIGRLRFRGVRVGVVSILFTGIVLSALFEDAHLPEIIYQLGLVIFVYAIGLNSGLTLWGSLRGVGIRANVLVASVIVAIAILATLLGISLDLDRDHVTGMFAGALTGTPALAAVLDYVRHSQSFSEANETLAQLVVGYSLAYPFALFGLMAVIIFFQKLWRIDYTVDAQESGEALTNGKLRQLTVLVTNPETEKFSVAQLVEKYSWDVAFGRYRREEETNLVTADIHLKIGDVVSVIGSEKILIEVCKTLGKESENLIHFDRSNIDYQRFFVSNPAIAGTRLQDLDLPRQFGAVTTRIRRGDIEFIPHGNTVLQPGDRMLVVALRDHMAAIGEFLGDSYRKVSEVNLLALGIGITLGLLLGVIPIPLGGEMKLNLGYAGGPLIVGIILGMLRRSGPLYWIIPYSAHQTVSQIGIVLFLSGIGVRAGHGFFPALFCGSGLEVIAGTLLLTVIAATLTIMIGYRIMKIPFSKTIGILAGLQTQSAILEFCVEQAENDLPKIGYTMVYPLASIIKIVLIQLIFISLL